MPTDRLLLFIATAALPVGLILPSILPEIANFTFFVLAGLALVMLAQATDWMRLLGRPAVLLPLVAGALLTACFVMTAREPLHALAAVYFMPMFLVALFVALFERAPWLVTPDTIGIAATLGALGAAGVACFDAFVLHLPRAGASVNNPIHFADLALTLGFVALVGVFAARRWVRALALSGPLLALVAVLLSGSRGPLVAFVPMSVVALGVLVIHYGLRHRNWLLIAVCGLVCFSLATLAWKAGAFSEVSAFTDVMRVLGNKAVDHSTEQRLVMYRAAYDAFQASPLYGHGLVDLTSAVARYVPAGAPFEKPPHLHSDIADFAVVGGIAGLVAYGLFLLAPLAEAARSGMGGIAMRPAVYLALVLPVGYAAMGLTNAMFGILSQTILYAFCLALIAHLASSRQTAHPESAQ